MRRAPFPDPGHDHLAMFRSHRAAVGAATAMYTVVVALFAVMAFDGGRDALQPIDDWWRAVMADARWDPLVVVAKGLSIAGSAVVTLPLRGAVAGWLWWRRRWAALTVWGVAIVSSELAIGLFKRLYERERPDGGLVGTSGFAFPSGHATATAVTVVALVIILLPAGQERRVWEVRAAAVAFAMALSRTYLQVHWLSDVVAGTLLGAATAIAVAAVVYRWRERYRHRLAAASHDRETSGG